jgi:hypothetical protein
MQRNKGNAVANCYVDEDVRDYVTHFEILYGL